MNGLLVIHVEMLLFLKEKYVIPKSAQFILSGRSGANAPCLVVGENNLKKGLVFCHQYQVILRMYRKEICSSTVWTVNDVLVNIYPFIILVDISPFIILVDIYPLLCNKREYIDQMDERVYTDQDIIDRPHCRL